MAFLMYVYQLIMMNEQLISSSLTRTAAATTCSAGVQRHRADQTDPNFKQNPLLRPEGKRSNTSVKYLCLSASSSSFSFSSSLISFSLPEEQSSPVVPVSFHKQPRGGSEVCASSQKQSTVWGIARPGGEPADQGQTHLSMTEERKREEEGQLWEV